MHFFHEIYLAVVFGVFFSLRSFPHSVAIFSSFLLLSIPFGISHVRFIPHLLHFHCSLLFVLFRLFFFFLYFFFHNICVCFQFYFRFSPIVSNKHYPSLFLPGLIWWSIVLFGFCSTLSSFACDHLHLIWNYCAHAQYAESRCVCVLRTILHPELIEIFKWKHGYFI